ncbi:MAG: PDZ domain-containing protein [Dehalococcoidia bacterium]|nr:PDZ domain-containing protein [Dehalococcoidia bacterium]
MPGQGGSDSQAIAPAASRNNAAIAQDNDFSEAINEVRPATVQITNQQVVLDPTRQPYTIPAGVGTGVIYKPDGHIITNDHVIAGAQSLLVSLPDGRSFEADLVGRDPRTDLAVLKIDGGNLPVAELGDSGEVEVGDWNVAIGHALGLPGGPTVTVGVTSALDRTAQEPAPDGGAGPVLYGLIQTDASINPGNSGGPLANLDGQVIGINTLIAGQVGEGIQAQGIGFAISINTAKQIAAELESNGRIDHAYLGVSYVPVSPPTAAQLGITQTAGAVVMEVVPGSPASQAGLSRGDVITDVEGQPVEGESDLTRLIDSHKPGDRITLKVARGDDTRDVQVTLAAAPD